MPVEVTWDDDAHTRIYYQFSGKWTWDEAWQAMSKASRLSADEDHTVHALIDLSGNTWFPPGAITQFRASRKMRPPNRGYLIIISKNTLIRTIENIIRLIFPDAMSDYHTAQSYEDALQRLAELIDDSDSSAPQNA